MHVEGAGPAGARAAASLIACTEREADRALLELVAASVITESAGGRFGMHDLLHAYAREQAQADGAIAEVTAARRRVLDYQLHSAHAMALRICPSRDAIALAPPLPGVLPEEFADHQQAWSWAEAECQALIAAVDLAVETGCFTHAWQLAWTVETFLSRRGRWNELLHVQELGLRAAISADDALGQAHTRCGIGWSLVLQGSPDQGRPHLAAAAGLFGRLGDGSGEARAHVRMGHTFWREGRYADASDSARRAYDLFVTAGDLAGQAGALNNIGLHHMRSGAPDCGLECCRQSLAIFRDLGYHRGEANVLDSLGEAYQRLGRPLDAISCFRQSLTRFRLTGDRYNQAEILRHLADVHESEGDVRALNQCLVQALAILSELQHPEAAELQTRLNQLDQNGSRDVAEGSDRSAVAP